MTRPTAAAGAAAAALGGASGAVARWALQQALPTSAQHFPWTTFAINVVGSALLAALPLLAAARTRPLVAVFLGTGVLGGFTTMSAASVDTVDLLHDGAVWTGLAYCLGTLAASLMAVVVVGRFTTAVAQDEVEDEEGDA